MACYSILVNTKVLCCLVTTAMFVTRVVYNRCIFLWWKRDCNDFITMLGPIGIVVCVARGNTRLLPTWACLLIGVLSHWIEDRPETIL